MNTNRDLLDLLKTDLQKRYRITNLAKQSNIFACVEQLKFFKKELKYDTIVIMNSSSENENFFQHYSNTNKLLDDENTIAHIKVLSKQTQSLRESKLFDSLKENEMEQFLTTHSYYSIELNDPFIIRYEIEYSGKIKNVYVIHYNAPIVFLLLQGILG
ncbi:hypothetical protein [Flavobacterium aciduliphilum]|uniref:Uncharacterized protein n=1 Tax=Flavobacterium aciduliphilum TaxID=1101402 RepID=A0A328YNR1_9FLAO|nr:hypothetical protein [Flavobacterium aciduliphilum]RAR73782.1 hypothetical protein CLV55_103101 [Flavobacterium aciduliphilum]